MTNRKWTKSDVFLVAVYWIFILYLFVPIVTMVVMSFKDGNIVGFPIEAWTTRWYSKFVQDRAIVRSIVISCTVAISSTLIALVIGTWMGAWLTYSRSRANALLFLLMCLPTVMPGIVSAIAMRLYLHQLALPTGVIAMILGHAIHSVPFVAVMVLTRLRSMPESLTEAARDLGANRITAFRLVTVPYLAPALVGAAMLCILLSFDDFLRSFFLGGYDPTFPVLVFARLTSGLSPEITAASSSVLISALLLAVVAERTLRLMRN